MSETSDSSSSSLPVRRLIFQLYLPWTCSQLGRGTTLPILPLYLREIGMTYSMTAVVLAAVGVGAVVGGLPAGAVASRSGPEALFVIAVVVLAITSAAVGLTEAAFALVLIQFMAGPGSVGLTIATQTILTNEVPVAVRGRSMAAVGGTVRFAFFVGPIVGGLLAQIAGFTVAFIACGVVNLVGLLPFMLSRPSVAGGRRLNRPTKVGGGMRDALRSTRGAPTARGHRSGADHHGSVRTQRGRAVDR